MARQLTLQGTTRPAAKRPLKAERDLGPDSFRARLESRGIRYADGLAAIDVRAELPYRAALAKLTRGCAIGAGTRSDPPVRIASESPKGSDDDSTR
jgi:hypothetical protein